MIPLTVTEVAALTGGVRENVDGDVVVLGPVVTDSRLATRGALFVALAGERADGHDHADEAVRVGAVAVLAARSVNAPAIVVDNTVRALGALAAGVVSRAPQCTVIGVTGSSGKTSTKDLLAAVLSHHGETIAPEGSFNNEIGFPLTALRVTSTARYLALEYAARRTGQIAYLTQVARPAIAVVLNVGTAHLGEFGSREAIAQAKGELVEALPPEGVAVLGVDDPLVSAMRSRTSARVVGFGAAAAADVRIEALTLDELARPRFRLVADGSAVDVALRLHGAHHAGNAAAVAAVGLAVGLTLEQVGSGLEQASAVSPHRMQVEHRRDGLVVIDDAYNANPESVRAALDSLAGLAAARAGRSWAVLGEMLELGDESAALHRAAGRYAAALGIDDVVAVGDAAVPVAEGAREVAGWHGQTHLVADVDAAHVLLADAVRPSDTVLVKASNAVALWRVAAALRADPARTSSGGQA